MKPRKLLLLSCVSHRLGVDPSWEWNKWCMRNITLRVISHYASWKPSHSGRPIAGYSKCLMFSVRIILVELPVDPTNCSPQISLLLNTTPSRQTYTLPFVGHLMICRCSYILSYVVMLCCVMLCCVMLCYVMFCFVATVYLIWYPRCEWQSDWVTL